MSQGYIGYHLQQAIDEELVARNLGEQPVVTLITQVVVDPKTQRLQNQQNQLVVIMTKKQPNS